MKLGQYQPLDEIELRNLFLNYIDALNIPLIDYVAIGIQDTIKKTSASLMSRSDWQKSFISQNLSADDPIRKATFNTNSNVFAFDEVDWGDSAGVEVMRQRKKFGIENGIVLVRRNFGYNFMLTLATGYKNFLSYKYLLENRIAINLLFDDLISMLSQTISSYKFYQPKYPSFDAK